MMRKFETELKMAEISCDLSRRTWRVLRLVLLFSRRLIREVGGSVKSFGGEKWKARNQHGERQLIFDKSPDVHVPMYRPASVQYFFSCINCGPDFDDDEEINFRAEKFIDEFYEQIRLQRQAIKVCSE